MFKKIKEFLFENKGTRQTVAKNSIWLSISNFGGRAIKAVIVIYGARVLGASGWGVFSYAVTLSGFFTLFVDPGINAILVRNGAKSTEEDRRKLFSTTLIMKVVILAGSALIILFIAPIFTRLPGAAELIPLIALIIIFDSLREFFSSLIRSMEKMEWDAAIFLFTNLVIVIAGFVFLKFSLTPRAFTWAYVAGTAAGALAAAYIIRGYFKKVFSYFSPKMMMPIIRSAWPFAITGALGILLTNTDILIISFMRTAADVGIYSAAIRIIQVLYLVPMILQFSSLPTLSRLAHSDRTKFRQALERSIGLIFLASVPFAIGGILLGTQIMQLIFGSAFGVGGASFKILMLGLMFDFPAAIITTAIFTYDNQKSLIITSAIGGAANVILDLILIPRLGITGSAISTLIAQALSNWYLWRTMRKINDFSAWPYLRKVIIAGAVMTVATAGMILIGINVVINIVISATVYLFALRLLREPLLIEIKNLVTGSRGNAEATL